MCATGCRRIVFLVLLILVFLTHSISTSSSESAQFPDRDSNESEADQSYPHASERATLEKNEWQSTTAPSAHYRSATPNHAFSPNGKPWQAGRIHSNQEERSQKHKGVGNPAKTLIEIQSAIRALAKTHNELLRTITRNEPWWYRRWILLSWSYSNSHLLNSDKRLYSSLKGLSNVVFDEEILQKVQSGAVGLPEEIQTYLQNLQCLAHSQTVQASPKPYSLIRAEDWRKWKDRLELIRIEVRASLLNNEFENQINVLLDKIEEFLRDFSDEYFRTQTTWLYYYDDSWLKNIFQKNDEVAAFEAAMVAKLQRVRNTAGDTFQKWKTNFAEEWKALIPLVPHFKWPFGLDQKAISTTQLLYSHFTELEKVITDLFVQSMLLTILMILSALYLLSYVIKTASSLIESTSRRTEQRHGQERLRPLMDTMHSSEDTSISGVISLSGIPQEQIGKRNSCDSQLYPNETQTVAKRSKLAPIKGDALFPISGEIPSQSSNASAVSFKLERPFPGANRKGDCTGSIDEQGPIRKSTKVTDSIRLGGRRINMVYGTRSESDPDENGEEIVAIVSEKENSVKQSGNPLLKKVTKKVDHRNSTGVSDRVAASTRRKKTRQTLEDSKRLLMDASNRSLTTEDTRVLKSKSNTAARTSIDPPAHRAMQGKSTRRRSARISAAHLKENES